MELRELFEFILLASARCLWIVDPIATVPVFLAIRPGHARATPAHGNVLSVLW